MGFKDITVGAKKAKPVAARFIESKKGTTGLEVVFEFEEPSTSSVERLNWVGWLSPAAMENTTATLVNVLGFNGNDEINEDGTFKDPKALNWDGEVSIVIEAEEYEGKVRPKIKWVNKLGGSAFTNCAPVALKSKLESLGFRAAVLAAKQQTTGMEVPF